MSEMRDVQSLPAIASQVCRCFRGSEVECEGIFVQLQPPYVEMASVSLGVSHYGYSDR